MTIDGDLSLCDLLVEALLRVAVPGENEDNAKGQRAPTQALGAARTRFRESLSEPSLLSALAWQAGLDADEAEVLAVLIVGELDPAKHRALATVAGQPPTPALTLAVLRRLFPAPHAGVLALAPDARLRRAELVDVDEGGAWFARAARLAPAVIWACLGDASLDPDLPTGARFVAGAGAQAGVPPLIMVNGADRESRLARAAALLPVRGILAIPCPVGAVEWRATIREATLRSVGVFIEVGDELPPDGRYWLERADHLAWAVSSAHELPLASLPDREWSEVTVESGEASVDEWLAVAGVAPPPGYQLDREQLRLVGAAAQGRADVVSAVRRLAGGHLERLTTRIHPRRTWGDLVLAPAQAEEVRLISERYRHRATIYHEWGFPPVPSTGVVALFAGPSGTGKTLTAEIIAGDLGLDLFKLDLSAVVSKYIGETEKNLEAVFQAAEAGEGVLLFDEADAVFGRRSSVRDARDRYANIESAYLLQRLERSDALVIMATNLAGNIDEAFLRRIHVSVDFRMPEETERRRLWELAFPPDCPREDLDLERLAATVELAGGPITNAAMSAAFRAASEGAPVTMTHVVAALHAELRKMGRIVNESALAQWQPAPSSSRE